MLRDHQGTLIRWLFGIGFLGLAYHFATEGYESGNLSRVVGGAGLFLLGFAFLCYAFPQIVLWLPQTMR